MENKEVKRELSQNELDEIFMSQLVEESESHRTGEIIGRNGNLLAEDKDFEGYTSPGW